MVAIRYITLPSNFYVDDDGDAGLTVAQLQRRSSEDGIDDLLDKLRGQVKVVKSVLAVLTEEESQVESERRRVEQDINVQYAAGLVSKVHTLENMYTAGEKKTALLQTENATLHKKLDTVQDALESRHGRLQSEVMYVRDKNAILCQDVASLQAENVKLSDTVNPTIYSVLSDNTYLNTFHAQ
nr:hypothetical protein BaRGS_002117 [Batillaria attramentaria]